MIIGHISYIRSLQSESGNTPEVAALSLCVVMANKSIILADFVGGDGELRLLDKFLSGSPPNFDGRLVQLRDEIKIDACKQNL